jgi:predicted GTPase
MGYDAAQLAALAATIRAAECDVVVCGSPIDLAALVELDRPVVRACYEYADAGEPTLGALVDAFIEEGARPR